MRQLNIPAEFQNNPDGAIQYLMNTGRITQAQYNQARSMAVNMQNNPMFQNLMNNNAVHG